MDGWIDAVGRGTGGGRFSYQNHGSEWLIVTLAFSDIPVLKGGGSSHLRYCGKELGLNSFFA